MLLKLLHWALQNGFEVLKMDKAAHYSIFKPGLSPKILVDKVRDLEGVCLTSTSMRDAGQSDFKNRLRIYDLKSLAAHYNNMGLFSVECHGGARWHVGIHCCEN